MKFLVIEDDESVSGMLTHTLIAHHHITDVAGDGLTGLELAQSFTYDLILLDVLLPRLDGISLCRRLRVTGYEFPIIFLTVKDSKADIVTGLDAGADDYIIKPCYPETLMARIRAVVRRSSVSILTPVLAWGDLRLYPSSASVTYQQDEIILTSKEYSLLELFLQNPQRVFSRGAILDRLWSIGHTPTESAVTNLIKDLRRKLRSAGMATELIETVYGLGYRLKVESSCSDSNSLSEIDTSTNNSEQNLSSVEVTLNRFRDTFIEKAIAISKSISSLETSTGMCDSELRKQAIQDAHKLAGGLGTFGWQKGSAIARQIELLLDEGAETDQKKISRLTLLCQNLQAELAQPPQLLSSVPAPSMSFLNVLVIDDDVNLAEKLCADAVVWGVEIEVANNPRTARQKIAHQLPDVILLDLTFADSDEDGLSLLEFFSHQIPHVPILVLTSRDSLDDRISVSRLGAKEFLHKPITSNQIFEAISQFSANPVFGDGRVMVVDDNLSMLRLVSNLLRPWGLTIRPLQDATQFWEVLTQFQPEVLILDVAMPMFSGIDLCRVVRQDRQWGDLPILVMTAYADSESVRNVFAAGADDFISKPIVAPELVTRVLSRIEGVRSPQ